jgi:hypothetical protein
VQGKCSPSELVSFIFLVACLYWKMLVHIIFYVLYHSSCFLTLCIMLLIEFFMFSSRCKCVSGNNKWYRSTIAGCLVTSIGGGLVLYKYLILFYFIFILFLFYFYFILFFISFLLHVFLARCSLVPLTACYVNCTH